MPIIYRHIRLDTNEVFYIGLGAEEKRAYSKSGRSSWWKKLTGKVPYEVEIIFEHEGYEFIKEKEKEFIKLYGRMDLGLGTLVNITDGGEGLLNPSAETRKKMSDAKQNIGGETHHLYGVPKTPEHIAKLSAARLGKKPSKESIAKSVEGRKNNPEVGIKVICTKTLNIYHSLRNAAIENKLQVATLRAYLVGLFNNPTSLMYLRDYEKNGAREYFTGKTVSKKVVNTQTKEVFKTITAAASSIGMCPKLLSGMLSPNNTRKNTTPFNYGITTPLNNL